MFAQVSGLRNLAANPLLSITRRFGTSLLRRLWLQCACSKSVGASVAGLQADAVGAVSGRSSVSAIDGRNEGRGYLSKGAKLRSSFGNFPILGFFGSLARRGMSQIFHSVFITICFVQVRGVRNFAANLLFVESGRFGTSGLSQVLLPGLKEVQAGSNGRGWVVLGRSWRGLWGVLPLKKQACRRWRLRVLPEGVKGLDNGSVWGASLGIPG